MNWRIFDVLHLRDGISILVALLADLAITA